eukprot:1807770-Rhodomonas_salina.1
MLLEQVFTLASIPRQPVFSALCAQPTRLQSPATACSVHFAAASPHLRFLRFRACSVMPSADVECVQL